MREILKPEQGLAKLLPAQEPCPGKTCVPSQFVLPFEVNDRHYLYHVLTKQCLEGELPSSAAAGDGYDELIRSMFLVPADRDECAFYLSVSGLVRMLNRKKSAPKYTILPTFACNARCVYCYEEGVPQTTMTPETADAAAAYILRTHGEGSIQLSWFGGEPFLFPETIERICGRLREAGCDFCSTGVTNGSLVDSGLLERMVKDWRFDSLQFSMDGAEEDYIRRKNYVRDADYYHSVIRSIAMAAEAGLKVVVRCNVDEENLPGVPRFIEDMRAGIACRERVGIAVTPLFQVRAGSAGTGVWRRVMDLYPMIEEAGFRAARQEAIGARFRVSFCMADGGDNVIAPDGTLYCCEHCVPGSRLGDVRGGIEKDAPGLVFRRADQVREKCRKCAFLPECTGFSACPVGDFHCREVREMQAREQLRELVESVGRTKEQEDKNRSQEKALRK